MTTQIRKLRRLNLVAALLHTISFLGIVLLSNDVTLPVTATYLTGPPTSDSFGAPITLLNLNVGFMIGAFLALSAFFHLLVISPKFWPRYTAGLEQRRNTFRWVEYSVSSSLMIIVILQLNGVSDFVALGGIFFVNVSMILFGWLQERYATPGDGDMLPFWFGSLVGAVPWVAILMMALSPKGPAGVAIPTFVWGIIVSLFVLFNCFALVQFKQYRATGRWSDYLHGERRYVVLSIVAKSVLAWQVFGGTLAP
jgi:hypothetical protein